MGLSDELRQKHETLWEKMVMHSFVRELGEGTLPAEKFITYFVQDYTFLVDATKMMALAISKAPDVEAAQKISAFLNAAITGEESLFRRGFEELGVPPGRYTGAELLPTALSYANFLLRTGHEGSFNQILTILMVVEWTYLDWAKRLVAQGKKPVRKVYQEWIDIHVAPALEEFVGWAKERIDNSPVGERASIEQTFLVTLRYEYLFWDMAYQGESWP
jgi:thiaminase/transcriptional activator TenA